MIAVIADDFTGAAEVAGICLREGVSVSMLTDIPDAEHLRALTTDVVVLAENTRSFTREGAVKISRLLAVQLKEAGLTCVVKKIDSVLRGWILPEMEAIASVFGHESLLIQPANTDTGRSVRNGMYFVGETLLSDTPFSNDPDFPAVCSSVEKLLEHRGGQRTLPIPYQVPDAQTDADLLHSVRLSNGNVLAGGSAAFWKAFLCNRIRLGMIKPMPVQPAVDDRFSLQDSLMICGSAHENSKVFTRNLAAAGFPVLALPEALCRQQKPAYDEFLAFVNLCTETWKRQHRLLIRLDAEPDFPQAPEAFGYRLTEIFYLVFTATRPSRLLIEGGATASSILKRMGWSSFTPVREWLPGVVELHLNEEPICNITLKPGSYAWPEFDYENH